MYLGIDLGTSGIKLVLMDEQGELVTSTQANYEVSRPHPLWSEQNPQAWIDGLDSAMHALAKQQDLSQIKAIGLAGQMHGATLLDDSYTPLRPAILWNDGRCEAECKVLEDKVHNSREITGNIAMPGFTAPKLLWVSQHEPDIFARIHKVLLPKDYLRYVISGTCATDMSDAAGTLWLDLAKREWSHDMLAASGLSLSHMPDLFEGADVCAHLLPEWANKWGLPNECPIVAGGGDNAAGAVGVGLISPGQSMLSLGTSGVYFVVTDGCKSNTENAVHSFCHALPKQWHLMSVMLSAASCADWFAREVANQDLGELFKQVESEPVDRERAPLFLPYLSGERTPHNNPNATGSFFGLTHQHSTIDLFYAVLEGVSFALAEGIDVVEQTGAISEQINLIGGGAPSAYWRQLLADICQHKMVFRAGGEVGPGMGAAILARIAIDTSHSTDEICKQGKIISEHYPNIEWQDLYTLRREKFSALYRSCAHLM